MKIDQSLLSATLPGRSAARQETSISAPETGGAPRRQPPSVGPAMPMPSGLSNALWLANVKKDEDLQAERDGLLGEFMELSRMSVAERLRKEILDKMGLTEESLKDLPPADRKVIEDEIRRKIQERFGIDETEEARNLATETGQRQASEA